MWMAVLLILVAPVAWLYYRRQIVSEARVTGGWRERPGAKRISGLYKGWGERIKTQRVTGVYKGWREKAGRRLRRRKRSGELSQRFQEWVAGASLEERKQLYKSLPEAAQAFTTWLTGLPAEEVETFSQKVSSFCSDFGFELAWLVDLQLDDDAELKQAAEEIVVLYCLAHSKATQVRGDVKAFATFQAWQDNPSEGQHKALGQKLFAKLVEQGLVSAPPSELFMASDEKRQEHVVQAIRQAAEENRPAFNAVLKEVVSSGDSSSAASPVPASTEEAPPSGSAG